jgi:hypothetical protein
VEGQAPDAFDGGVLEDPALVGADRDSGALEGMVTAAAGPAVGGIGMDGVQIASQIDRVTRRTLLAGPEGGERALEGRQLEAEKSRMVRRVPLIGAAASVRASATLSLAHRASP